MLILKLEFRNCCKYGKNDFRNIIGEGILREMDFFNFTRFGLVLSELACYSTF